MSFTYPLGLLGLLAIPLLILIYILKNKHTEQVIASTYLWTLSERFLKRRKPISRLTGIISLILQILIVVCISLATAHPVFTLKNAADDYVFILDGSGSMCYEENGKTRFALGKEKIAELIEDAPSGSAYTLIYAGESTGVLYENLEDRAQALSILEDAQVSTMATGFADARGTAQEYFTQKPASKVYLVTDKGYDSLENVELISLSSALENYAVADLATKTEGGKLVVTGSVCSYQSAAELMLRLEVVDGQSVTSLEQTIAVEKGEEKEFRFETENIAFQSVKVRVQNEDSLPLDNESEYFNVSASEEGSILIVSDDPFFLTTAFKSVYGGNSVKALDTKAYQVGVSGYQLYVFEGYSPEVLPTDGAVWFVNPVSSVENSGFSVQGTQTLAVPGRLEYSTSTSTRVQALLKDTNKDDISIGEYVKCSLYRNFHTVLSYEGNSVVFAGTNSHDNREVVFAFDFHKSDFVLKFDYMTLIRNMLEFTFPTIVEKTDYYCGESVAINVLANCKSIRIDTPNGDIVYLSTSGDLAEFTVTEVGTHKITQMIEGVPHIVFVYGNLPKTERASAVNEGTFALSGTPSSERRDGKYDDLIILFIILAVIFIADWAVYCYEQYQLR